MKKIFLYFLVACVTSVTISQIINSTNAFNNNSNKIETTLNKDNQIITKLNQDHFSRTDELNNKIKKNFIDSITLVDKQITINYQNLNRDLYSDTIYQIILSQKYIENLTMQFEMNFINFDIDNHINFDTNKISNYSSDVWMETRWYWFLWAKLHFSYNGIWKLINAVERVAENPASKAAAITSFLFTQLPIVTVLAVAIGVFIAASYFVILSYSNNPKGCWLGILGVVPGFGWGSN